MMQGFDDIKEKIVLLTEDIIDFHHELAEKYVVDVAADKNAEADNSMPRIESALSSVFADYFGYEPYPTLIEKAAALLYFLAKDHCFHDGNKRVAVHSMETFLYIHNVILSAPDTESVIIKIASSDPSDKDFIIGETVEWLKKWIEEIDDADFMIDREGNQIDIVMEPEEE